MNKQVYFIGEKEKGIGAIKIGISSHPMRRLHTIQSYSPLNVEILAVKPGSRAEENRIHKQFAEDRLWGEWFSRSPELMSLIESLGVDPDKNFCPKSAPSFHTFITNLTDDFVNGIETPQSRTVDAGYDYDANTLWIYLESILRWWNNSYKPNLTRDCIKSLLIQKDSIISVEGPEYKRIHNKTYWNYGIHRKDGIPIYDPPKQLIVNIKE